MAKLSRTDLDIATIAANTSGRDQTLEILLSMSAVAGFGITLAAGGVIIAGDLAPETKWGERLDETLAEARGDNFRQMLVDAGFEDDEHLDRLVGLFETSFKDRAIEQGKREGEHIEKAGELGDVPLHEIDDEDLARGQIVAMSQEPVLTLVNARVYVGPKTWEAGTIRVLTRQIAAWWPGRPT